MTFKSQSDNPRHPLRKRTLESFLCVLERVSKRLSYDEMGRMLGVNNWHIHQMLTNLDYVPSKNIRHKLNIVLRKRDRRVAVHCTDIESALATLTNPKNFDPEMLDEIKRRL